MTDHDTHLHFADGRKPPLHLAVDRLLALADTQAHDLRHCTVLVPEARAIPTLLRLLQTTAAARGIPALLAPVIDTLSGWLARHCPPPATVLSASARELLLVEALQDHPLLFNQADPWGVAADLLALFDDLTQQDIALPDDLEAFTAQLARGYGITGAPPAPLSQEARIVHTLWQAWRAQLDAEQCLDSAGVYAWQLRHSLTCAPADTYFLLVGLDAASDAEWNWCAHWLQQRRAELIVQLPMPPAHLEAGRNLLAVRLDATSPTPDAHADTLRRIFAEQPALRDRSLACAQAHPRSALASRLRVLRAEAAEQEAQAVDLQVRRWLLAGRQRIGIVTEDRRLARRVRALLQRAGIALQDQAGWALSTTRAAAALERWLQCIEEDFAHQPLLDLLKSPFVFPDQDRDAFSAAVHRLEQDIIRHENIERGIARYRHHLHYRQRRLQAWDSRHVATLETLFTALEHAAAPLLRLTGAAAQSPRVFLDAMYESLQRLGMARAFADDAAGARMLEVLEQLPAAFAPRRLRMDWQDWRDFLGRCLEQHNFQPPQEHGPVRLLNLAQSRLADFDAVIVAGADLEHLPGRAPQTAFFNRGVRRQLDLPGWGDSQALAWSRLLCLLENTGQVLLTYTGDCDGEDRPASPWLALIQAFHACAYADDLSDTALMHLLTQANSQVREGDDAPLPAPVPVPRPRVMPALLPETWSASSHQSLIDCPYQFYAGECLGLKPLEEIRLALEKSDFGQRVHTCLEAFHRGLPHLPPAFDAPIDAAHRDAAIAHLEHIATAVFQQDLEDNFLHRGWLRRWQAAIPAYIDWQIDRGVHWQVTRAELRAEVTLAESLRIKGRLDRVDGHAGQFAVLDYKTGTPPSQAEVLTGEAVQLPTYALLQPDCVRVEYLVIEKDGVKGAACIEGEVLADLQTAVQTRLTQLHADIRAGQALPAWGDSRTCERCSLDGVCRRAAWTDKYDR